MSRIFRVIENTDDSPPPSIAVTVARVYITLTRPYSLESVAGLV